MKNIPYAMALCVSMALFHSNVWSAEPTAAPKIKSTTKEFSVKLGATRVIYCPDFVVQNMFLMVCGSFSQRNVF